MKEIYLAMDRNGTIYGYDEMPEFNSTTGEWIPKKVMDAWINITMLMDYYGIDVAKFPITHETPIKIRAVWEVVSE